jgi:mono/diheme cytochrome c family protein
VRTIVNIILLVLATCAVYTCVGHLVPQKEEHPPPLQIATDDPQTLAEEGKKIFPGTCGQCHGVPGAGGTERAPDQDGVAVRAAGRAQERTKQTGKPYTPEDYLLESVLNPSAYIVERSPGVPYGNIMSFKLQPNQILAVVAYLESLGGQPTITGSSESWKKWGGKLEEAAAQGGAGGGPVPQGPPEEMIKKYGCIGCHDFTGKTLVPGGGPWLSDIGARKSPGDILMQIILPDSEIAKNPSGVEFPKGLMRPTLEGNAFYREVGQDDLQKLVLWLAAKKGK